MIFPGFELLRTFSSFKNSLENSSSYVYALHWTSNEEVPRRSRAVDVKEMY